LEDETKCMEKKLEAEEETARKMVELKIKD